MNEKPQIGDLYQFSKENLRHYFPIDLMNINFNDILIIVGFSKKHWITKHQSVKLFNVTKNIDLGIIHSLDMFEKL